MKKFFNYLSFAAIASMIMVACSKNESVENLPEVSVRTVNFSAKTANPSTKTAFGDKTDAGYPTVWTSNQKVSIALNYANAQQADVIPSADGKTANFDVTVTDDESGNYVFYAISPAVDAIAWDASSSRVEIEFPATQTPTMTSVDEAAHIMAAKSATFTEFPENVSLAFSHIAAYGKFMLTNFPEDVTIEGIELTADENIAGRAYFYPETGAYADNSASKTINLNVSAISAESNASKVFWFAVKPVDLQGKNLKVTVHTDDGDYVKTITFPSGKGNFQAGRVAAFNINMAGITPPPTEKTATIQFGNNGTKINAESVTGKDSQNNTWTITTLGNPYYEQFIGFSLIGERYSASSITFTTTLRRTATIKNFSVYLGGLNDPETEGKVDLIIDGTTVKTGYLDGEYGITVTSTTQTTGTELTITITNIEGAVKAYNISVTYVN